MTADDIREIRNISTKINNVIKKTGYAGGRDSFLNDVLTACGINEYSRMRTVMLVILRTADVVNSYGFNPRVIVEALANIIKTEFRVQSASAIDRYAENVMKVLRHINYELERIDMEWTLSEPNFSNHIIGILKRGHV